ncbi:MAG: hypothetical protein JWP35_3633 [Caulobacter sp.]|nr:hypothetical protein [Caulobacter sp.]
MKAKDALIGWTPDDMFRPDEPTAGQVLVTRLPKPGEDDPICPFLCAGGAALEERRTMSGWKQIAMVFIDYHALVAGDGIDPEVAHDAMLEIDEFRRFMAQDIAGSETCDSLRHTRGEVGSENAIWRRPPEEGRVLSVWIDEVKLPGAARAARAAGGVDEGR